MTEYKTNNQGTLLISGLASFLIAFMSTSINIALPIIGKDFVLNAVTMGWVVATYLVAAAIFLVPSGKLADIYGRKLIFRNGVILFIFASSMLAISASELVFIIFRIFQGIGGAMILATSVAILTSVYPPGERGRVLGINSATVYLGQCLGPVLGGILTQHFGWRSIFYFSIVWGIFILFLIKWKLKGEWIESKGEKYDLTGSLMYGISLLSVSSGFLQLPSLIGTILIFTGIIGLFLFSCYERRKSAPLMEVSLFLKNRVFTFSSISALINYSAVYGVGFLLSLYLQYIKQLSPGQAGLVLIVQPVIQAIISPITGKLSDRFEPGIVASVGMFLTGLALMGMIFLGNSTTLGFIICCQVLLGLGLAFFASPNTNAIMSSVDKRFYGLASGIMATMRFNGQMLSMSVSMIILSIYVGKTQIITNKLPQFLLSIRANFSVMAILCVVGIFTSMIRGKVRK